MRTGRVTVLGAKKAEGSRASGAEQSDRRGLQVSLVRVDSLVSPGTNLDPNHRSPEAGTFGLSGPPILCKHKGIDE